MINCMHRLPKYSYDKCHVCTCTQDQSSVCVVHTTQPCKILICVHVPRGSAFLYCVPGIALLHSSSQRKLTNFKPQPPPNITLLRLPTRTHRHGWSVLHWQHFSLQPIKRIRTLASIFSTIGQSYPKFTQHICKLQSMLSGQLWQQSRLFVCNWHGRSIFGTFTRRDTAAT